MENIAKNTKVDLQRQTDKLEKVHQNVGKINDDLTHSHKTLDEIKRQRRINRLIIYGVIAFIALAVALIAYFKIIA